MMDLKDLIFNNNNRSTSLVAKTNVQLLAFKSLDFY